MLTLAEQEDPERDIPTIQEFITMVKAYDGEEGAPADGHEALKAQAAAQLQTEMSNRPAALLERIYPFMLSKDLNIDLDLCLFAGCTEEQLDDMLSEYQMIIEVLWY